MATTAKTVSRWEALRNNINTAATALGVNTLEEVGVIDSVLDGVVNELNRLYGGSEVPSDHWPHTPLMERTATTLNTMFNARMSGFHVWQILHRTRKSHKLAHSGASKKAFTDKAPAAGRKKNKPITR